MDHVLIYILLAFLYYRKIARLVAKNTVTTQENTVKTIKYLVNGYEIPCTFEKFYYDRLHLGLPVTEYDPVELNRKYKLRLIGDKLDKRTLHEVEAAKDYFIDRTAYLSSLN